MPEGDGYSGGGKYKRLRVDAGEPGFWMGRQFGVSYEFSFTTRQVLKFYTPLNALLYQAQLQVDTGGVRYRVFAHPDDTIETAPFTTPIPIHALNLTDLRPPYAGKITGFTGGDVNTAGLDPFPVARLRVSNATGHQATAGSHPGMTRGFGPGYAYIVMEPLTGVTGATNGVLDLRFEERDWGY